MIKKCTNMGAILRTFNLYETFFNDYQENVLKCT